MSIDDIVAPLRWIDEQVQRQHTKLALKTGLDQGRKKYYCGLAIQAVSVALTYIGTHVGAQNFGGPMLYWSTYAISGFTDNMWNWAGMQGFIQEDQKSEGGVAADPIAHFMKNYCKKVRFTTLAAGVGFTASGAVRLYNHLANGEPLDPLATPHLLYGVGLMVQASSMYIKDIDPKLLEKQTMREKAYNWLQEKIQEWQPQPEPVPVRVRRYSSASE